MYELRIDYELVATKKKLMILVFSSGACAAQAMTFVVPVLLGVRSVFIVQSRLPVWLVLLTDAIVPWTRPTELGLSESSSNSRVYVSVLLLVSVWSFLSVISQLPLVQFAEAKLVSATSESLNIYPT